MRQINVTKSEELKSKLIWSIFWAMVGVFVIVASMIFIPPLIRLDRIFVLLPFMAVFLLLGVTLLVLTVKTKVGGMLKKFLLLTGASAVGLLVCVILHNVVSGLFHTEEAVFFILGLIVCPIGFLVGIIGTIVLAIKNKPPKFSVQDV